MSFRNRLHLLWAIALIAPTVAVLALLLDRGTAPSDAEGRAQQGLRAAFTAYEAERSEARRELFSLSSDPRLRAALAGAPSLELERRAEQIVRANPRIVALAFYTADGQPLVRAGATEAVAYAAVAPTVPAGGRLGMLAASSATARGVAGRVRRLTGLHARLVRDEDPLASTLGPLAAASPVRSGEADIGGREFESAYGTAPEPFGSPVRLGVLAPAGGAGASGVLLVVVALLFAVMVAAAILAWLLLQKRLEALIGAARRLRGGSYRTRVGVHGDDRLASLAGELNALSDELASKVEQGRDELEDVTRRVGDAFASGLDPDAVVDLAVRTGVESCAADAGRAVPVDPSKMRSVRVGLEASGLNDALTAAERRVFRVGPAEGRELRRRIDGDRHAPTGRTFAEQATVEDVHAQAAPLRARVSIGSATEYLGVISIARRTRPFTESERDLFAYLAAQTAVSIENAFTHQSARRQAVTDELTGLANARRFHEALAREFERTRRFRGKVSLVMMDIDDFKRVNDEFGHQQGDIVLVEVARELREQCREIDHIARYGGEEMALILPETDLTGAVNLAERVRRAIARKPIGRLRHDGQIAVTASFGVAAVPESAADAQALIAAADEALYRAKRAGKNRVAAAASDPGRGNGEPTREAPRSGASV